MGSDLDWFGARLRQHLDPYLSITDEQVSALFTHYGFLTRWNQRLNLTSIRSPEEIVVRHYCESLFFAAHIPPAQTIADIGSGAGFPGVGVAVVHPEASVTLVESHQRKAVFLRESTRHLKNVRVAAERAESSVRLFELIVSRAVDPEFVISLVGDTQQVALLIGSEEWAKVQAANSIRWVEPIQLPWGDRRLLVWGQHVPRGTLK